MNTKFIIIFLVSAVVVGVTASITINKHSPKPPSTLNIPSDYYDPVKTDENSIDDIVPTDSIPKTNQISQSDLSFSVLYPPTPTSFVCSPRAEAFETKQGKVIRTHDQWKVLYDELLKSCHTKTQAPNLVDFSEQMMLAVFAGMSPAETHIEIKDISETDSKIIVRSLIVEGGPRLPAFSYPLTLILLDKSDLRVDFQFEFAKYPAPF